MYYKINTVFKKYETLEDAKILLEELENNKMDLTLLDLSMNTYTPIVMDTICQIIQEMPKLNSIILESIFDSLTFEEMSHVLSSISKALSRDIKSFELPSNAVSCDFPKDFESFLSECPLTVLNLYNCGLGQEGLKRISNCLERLENKNNLQVLNISKNRINKIDDSFGPTVKKFKNLTEFRIRNNTIEEESMGRFLGTINNEKLEILDLSDNFICGNCIDSLGDLFNRVPINQLYLQDTKMDEGDIDRLLKSFNNKKVQAFPGGLDASKPELVLDISCLDFEQQTVDLLEILAQKFYLKKLIIFENCYEDISGLADIIHEDGGIIIEEEENEDATEIDQDLIEKLKNL